METNAKLMAQMCRFDGARLLFHNMEYDRFEQVVDLVRRAVLVAVNGDVDAAAKGCKVKVLRHETSKAGSLKAIFLSGEAAQALWLLPWRFAHNLTELHVKVYAVERFPGAHGAVADACYTRVSTIAAQLSFFGNKARAGNSKSSGEKGVRVGSRKSDKHAVIYKRVNERTGIETRVRDKALKKAVEATETLMIDIGRPDDFDMAWRVLKSKAATVGYSALVKTLGDAGVDLADYFSHVSTTPEHDSPLGALLITTATQGREGDDMPV